MTKNLFTLNEINIFKVYKNVYVARKNKLNDFISSTSLLKGGFEHIHIRPDISHAQRIRLFIRTHEAIATAIKQYKFIAKGKKDENPPFSVYNIE